MENCTIPKCNWVRSGLHPFLDVGGELGVRSQGSLGDLGDPQEFWLEPWDLGALLGFWICAFPQKKAKPTDRGVGKRRSH